MADQIGPLSERELEILRLVATGAANKEIASRLVISPNTVKVHLRNIFAKIGVSSRTEATLYAIQIGLVRPSGDQDEVVQARPNGNGLLPVKLTGSQEAATITTSLSNEAKAGRRSRALAIWGVGLVLLVVLGLVGAVIFNPRLREPAVPKSTQTVAAQSATLPLSLQRWSKKADLPEPRKGMGIAEYGNAFYLIAGETAAGIDDALLRYSPSSNTWQTLPKKPTPVTDVQAALLGEKIYIPGGRLKDGSDTDRMEIYNPREEKWEESKARLPVPLSGYAMVQFEGRLYLFGGKSGDAYQSTVYVYTPQEDRWTEGTAMSGPRAYAGAVVVNERIYVMGGYDGKQVLNRNEAYYPTRDTLGEEPWETFQAMPEARSAMGITQLAGMVYLLGGMDTAGLNAGNGQSTGDGQNAGASALQYLAQTDQWAAFDSPPEPVGSHTALLASGNFLYALGGETLSGLSSNNQSFQALYTISAPIISGEK